MPKRSFTEENAFTIACSERRWRDIISEMKKAMEQDEMALCSPIGAIFSDAIDAKDGEMIEFFLRHVHYPSQLFLAACLSGGLEIARRIYNENEPLGRLPNILFHHTSHDLVAILTDRIQLGMDVTQHSLIASWLQELKRRHPKVDGNERATFRVAL